MKLYFIFLHIFILLFLIYSKVRLCTALNKRSLEILNQELNLNINQINSLFRAYNHRINVDEPELFYKILDR